MRDKNRIDKFLDFIGEYWKKYFPDWRFGQLMVNLLCWAQYKNLGDPFFWEEDKFLEYLDMYIKDGNSPFYKSKE